MSFSRIGHALGEISRCAMNMVLASAIRSAAPTPCSETSVSERVGAVRAVRAEGGRTIAKPDRDDRGATTGVRHLQSCGVVGKEGSKYLARDVHLRFARLRTRFQPRALQFLGATQIAFARLECGGHGVERVRQELELVAAPAEQRGSRSEVP